MRLQLVWVRLGCNTFNLIQRINLCQSVIIINVSASGLKSLSEYKRKADAESAQFSIKRQTQASGVEREHLSGDLPDLISVVGARDQQEDPGKGVFRRVRDLPGLRSCRRKKILTFGSLDSIMSQVNVLQNMNI